MPFDFYFDFSVLVLKNTKLNFLEKTRISYNNPNIRVIITCINNKYMLKDNYAKYK